MYQNITPPNNILNYKICTCNFWIIWLDKRCDGMVDIYNYYNEKPLFDQNLVACNQTRNNPLMFPDEMFCNENPTWSSIVIANIVFASFGIVLSTVLIFICFDALRDGCYVIFYSRWRRKKFLYTHAYKLSLQIICMSYVIDVR